MKTRKTVLSDANVKTNRMATSKWTYHKEWSFVSNSSYFIFLENLFQFQNPLKRVSYLMCTNGPNVHIRIFHKRWSLILCYGSFSLMWVSLKLYMHASTPTYPKKSKKHYRTKTYWDDIVITNADKGGAVTSHTWCKRLH